MDSNAHSAEALAIPSELMGLRPRRVRLSGNSLLGVTIAAVLLLAGIATGFFIVRKAMQETQQREALREASAVIGNSEALGTIDQLSSYKNSHSVRYSFIADNGAIYTGKSEVPDRFYAGLHTSDALPIRYLPADPTVNHPAAWEQSDYFIWGRLIGSSIFVVSGLFLLLMMRGDRRLVAEGTPVVAVVTSCSGPVGRSVWFSVTYDFRTEDGTEMQGTGKYGSSLEIGTKLVVLYLPQNPQRNGPYASAYYRAVE
jgi:hypothetical protein